MSGFYSLGTVGGGLAASSIAAAGFAVPVHLVVLSALLATALIFVGPGLLPYDEAPEEDPAEVRSRSRWRPSRAIIILAWPARWSCRWTSCPASGRRSG